MSSLNRFYVVEHC